MNDCSLARRTSAWLLLLLAALGVASSAHAQDFDPIELQGWVIARDDDATDKTERVVLLLPTGPLLVELVLTIDDQPYRTGSEKTLRQQMVQADRDGDGKLTWDEVGQAPMIGYTRGPLVQPNQPVDFIRAQYDFDRDGQVSMYELRRLYAQLGGGPPLMVQGQAFLTGRPDGSQLWEMLNENDDGELSADEIAQAPARLLSRDADDNEIITPEEIAGFLDFAAQQGQSLATLESIVALRDPASAPRLHGLLVDRYGREGKLAVSRFKLARHWAMDADTDRDGLLSADESAAFWTAAPPLTLDVALGTRAELRDTVVATFSDELKGLARTDRGVDGRLRVDLGGVVLEFIAPNPKPNFRRYDGQAKTILANLDRDKNGYLDKDEAARDRGIAMQFEAYDIKRDGMLFPDEIEQGLSFGQRPAWDRITVAALAQGNDLFRTLDENGDQRLSAREVRRADQKLAAADKDGDQCLTLAEYPVQFRLAIARGDETHKYLTRERGLGRRLRQSFDLLRSGGPDWYEQMDTNRDGDISPREFLGTSEQFDKLDANGDGVIDNREADKATP